MKNFTDNQGRQWTLEVNVNAIKRVRGLVGVDLYALLSDGLKPLGELLGDPCKFVDVLYCLCKSEADARKVDDSDFGRAMVGDVLTLAADALVEELINFFPNARGRQAMTEALRKSKEIGEKILTHGEKAIREADPDALAQAYIDSLTSAPASLASTLDLSRSGN